MNKRKTHAIFWRKSYFDKVTCKGFVSIKAF